MGKHSNSSKAKPKQGGLLPEELARVTELREQWAQDDAARALAVKQVATLTKEVQAPAAEVKASTVRTLNIARQVGSLSTDFLWRYGLFNEIARKILPSICHDNLIASSNLHAVLASNREIDLASRRLGISHDEVADRLMGALPASASEPQTGLVVKASARKVKLHERQSSVVLREVVMQMESPHMRDEIACMVRAAASNQTPRIASIGLFYRDEGVAIPMSDKGVLLTAAKEVFAGQMIPFEPVGQM